jgi:D-amino-acid oxidase
VERGRVLVLGGGVIGLTTSLVLRRRGWNVTVLAERFASGITSNVAGALWEWPPAVCGHHRDLERAKRWAAAGYGAFSELAADPATGVFLRPVTFYFKHRLETDPFQQNKMAELAVRAKGFRHDAALIAENGVGPRERYVDAYRHIAPMIDTDVYLKWLKAGVVAAGGTLIERRLSAPLEELAPMLRDEFGAAAIVNCTGFGSRALALDPGVYPLRGALIRVVNDGRAMPRIAEAHCVSHDGVSRDPGFIFILPRGDNRLLLGGLVQPHETDLNLTPGCPLVKELFRRCVEFLPVLKNAEVDGVEPLRVGLRPAREPGVRLEWDAATRIVHNYGHGGSGVTLSWGCAREAAELLE